MLFRSGMVHQEFSLIPGFTATENILLNREPQKKNVISEVFGPRLNTLDYKKMKTKAAEDIDETALSYAEIKMLATGNPYIKEKMDLDIQVQKLKMLKSNFLSEKYGLEDKVIKFYPQQIAYLKSRVEGLTKDVETAKLHQIGRASCRERV